MTSTNSLFACAAVDVTLDLVRAFVSQDLPESMTLEYKERHSPELVTTVAAMANSYGGLILVGVTDQRQDNRLVGVQDTTVVQIVNACHDTLEPPWVPEIIPVLLSSEINSYILVVKVDPAQAPRPILIKGAAPIRLHGRNAIADRSRLAQLFTESPGSYRRIGHLIPTPQLPMDQFGSPAADFVLRSGLVLSVDEAATWRPLSERSVDALADSLNNSPLSSGLIALMVEMGINGFRSFHRSGFNRARRARLAWQADTPDSTNQHPIEAITDVCLIGAYGEQSTSLQLTLDVIVRARTFMAARYPSMTEPFWELDMPNLYKIIDGILTALIDLSVVRTLADLAGVDSVIVPQPTNLHFITGPSVKELLNPYGLTPVQEAGSSHGASLIADPTLDLSDNLERQKQLDDWLIQIALDAGLVGMEPLLVEYHNS